MRSSMPVQATTSKRRRVQRSRRQALAGEGSSSMPPLAQEARMMEIKDWSSTPGDVVVKIAELLLSKDVTEYIRFRAVCTQWRQYTVPPSNTERNFRPRNWILITSGQRDKFSRRRVKISCCFLNVSTGDYLRVNIPQFREGYTPISFVDGLLVLLKKKTGALSLLHPFSLSLTELPNVDSLLSIVPTKRRHIQGTLSSVNFLSSSIVIFCFHLYHKVVFARIGGNTWFSTDHKVRCISTLSFEDKLYATAWMSGEVLQFDLEEVTDGSGLDPKLNVMTLIPSVNYPNYCGILESEGQMLLVQEYEHRRCCFVVYKVDVDNRRLIPTTIPRDRTFFASDSRCLSVSTLVSPSIIPQSIYYYRRGAAYIGVHHSHRPNLAPTNYNGPFVQQIGPHSIPRHLIRYYAYYPHPENSSGYNGPGPYVVQIGPYSLPSHLICYCSNFAMTGLDEKNRVADMNPIFNTFYN